MSPIHSAAKLTAVIVMCGTLQTFSAPQPYVSATGAPVRASEPLTAPRSARVVTAPSLRDHRARVLRTQRILRLEATFRSLAPDVKKANQASFKLNGWFECVSVVKIDESGDPGRETGFEYDERDGTGIGHRRALTVHHRPTRATWDLLTLSRSASCRSAPVRVGLDADPIHRTAALVKMSKKPLSWTQINKRITKLRHKVNLLQRDVRRDMASASRFDEWESCLVWLPVTQHGDAEQNMGFRFRAPARNFFLPAVGIDRSPADDPDYQLLAFMGSATPFTKSASGCDRDPGESADREAGASSTAKKPKTKLVDRRIKSLQNDLAGIREDLGDIGASLGDFELFDQCMYTVGMSEAGADNSSTGYVFKDPDGQTRLRGALLFDLGGFDPPQMDVMAFPGEEPPQIECDEDAGGLDTDE